MKDTKSARAVHDKRAIILLGHGSRVPEAGQGMLYVADRLKEKYKHQMVEICFLSRLGPHFEETFERCVQNGATYVLVIPYFLHTGLHIRLDIPEMLIEAGKRHSRVKLVLGKNFGYDDALVDIVQKRICSSQSLCDVRDLKLPPRENFPVPPGQCEFLEVPPALLFELKAQVRDKQGPTSDEKLKSFLLWIGCFFAAQPGICHARS